MPWGFPIIFLDHPCSVPQSYEFVRQTGQMALELETLKPWKNPESARRKEAWGLSVLSEWNFQAAVL
jgi:hypothetical protein